MINRYVPLDAVVLKIHLSCATTSDHCCYGTVYKSMFCSLSSSYDSQLTHSKHGSIVKSVFDHVEVLNYILAAYNIMMLALKESKTDDSLRDCSQYPAAHDEIEPESSVDEKKTQ